MGQVTVGNVSSSDTGATGQLTHTLSHTCAIGSNLLVALVSTRRSPSSEGPATVTYGGVALTRLDNVENAGMMHVSIFYLKNPVVNTAQNVVVTYRVAHYSVLGLEDYGGVGNTPFGATASANATTGVSTSISIPSVVGGRVIDVIARRQSSNNPIPNVIETYRRVTSNATATNNLHGAGQVTAGTGSNVTLSWSWGAVNRESAQLGVCILPAGGMKNRVVWVS